MSRIYLHFLDLYHYSRALIGGRTSDETLAAEARRAFRLAALVGDTLYLPASSYFEGELAQLVIADHTELVEFGAVYISASQSSLEEHREEKLPQYPVGIPGGIPGAYTTMPHVPPPPYRQKAGSSRAGITSNWMSVLERDALKEILGPEHPSASISRVERAWELIPDMLEGRAFVSEHVRELLAKRRVQVAPHTLAGVIEPAYIDGYASSLGAEIVGDLVYLGSPFALDCEVALSFSRTVTAFEALGLMPLLDAANMRELLRFKKSSEWQELWPILKNGEPLTAITQELAMKAAKVAAGSHGFPSMGFMDCAIGIVTALPEEFAAMRALMESPGSRKIPNDPNRYAVGTIPALRDGLRIGTHRVALTQLRRAGNESAAAAAANLIRSFPGVRLVLMVGVACGVPSPADPSKHVRLGDIIVCDRQGVVGFTAGVATEDGLEHRDALPPPSAVLVDAINALEADELQSGLRPWLDHLSELTANATFTRPAANQDVLYGLDGVKIKHPKDTARRAGEPRVFRGLIGSSNILLRDPALRDELALRHGLRAIEMEASGIASATWDHGQPYGIVRAACDYGDANKNDAWHNYAAASAAGYARSLIEQMAPEDFLETRAMDAVR